MKQVSHNEANIIGRSGKGLTIVIDRFYENLLVKLKTCSKQCFMGFNVLSTIPVFFIAFDCTLYQTTKADQIDTECNLKYLAPCFLIQHHHTEPYW